MSDRDDVHRPDLGITREVAAKLLAVRDAMVRGDHEDAWYQLYSVADPTFTATHDDVFDLDDHGPWNAMEVIAGIRGADGRLIPTEETIP